MKVLLACLCLLLVSAAAVHSRSFLPAHVLQNGGDYTLENGFVSVTLSTGTGCQISSLRGDFEGQGNYGEQLLAGKGYVLESQGPSGAVASSQWSQGVTVTVVSNGPDLASITVANVTANNAIESWSLSLPQASRTLELNTTGTVSDSRTGFVRHTLLTTPISVFGFYAGAGVAQMMNGDDQHAYLPSNQTLERVYMLGGVNPTQNSPDNGTQASVDVLRSPTPGQLTGLISGAPGGSSGYFELLRGSFPEALLNSWGNGTMAPAGAALGAMQWHTSCKIAPNNRNFPAGTLRATGSNLPLQDLAALMTGIYGSAPGCLCTFPNSPSCPGMEGGGSSIGQIATTVNTKHNGRGYSGTYNYFDPDNFFSMTSLIYSGEPFLQEEARKVIARSGAFLCIGAVAKQHKCSYGQLPHHFQGTTPTYLALSGATQTGPNMFWTKSALMYARNSANMPWLKAYMPTLRAAAQFCFDLINPSTHLLLAPGSLMIDVFIRANYTADSNAMMVGFLNEFADAEEAVGNSTGASVLRAQAGAMAQAMRRYLWDGTDHFVTQVDPDNMDCAKSHSCRDFVDYDSNTIAVAHNITSPEMGKAVLRRIDTGIQKCVAAQGGGPQWVSEVYYGTHDTTGGNIGDSASAMGRIAWFDAKARKVLGDVASFDAQLAVMQQDLTTYTWMHERYGCDGRMQLNRTAAYFEYPSTVAILLREIRYGVELGYGAVVVDPMPNTAFSYHVGNVDVEYDPHGTTHIVVPTADGDMGYRLHGMRPGGKYTITDCSNRPGDTTAMSDATVDGVLRFHTSPGNSCNGVTVRAVI